MHLPAADTRKLAQFFHPSTRMTRDPVDRGLNARISRLDIPQMSKQRIFQRESGGAKCGHFAHSREWRPRTGTPDVTNSLLSIG